MGLQVIMKSSWFFDLGCLEDSHWGKKGGSDAQVVVKAKLDVKLLSVPIELFNTEMTNAPWPEGVLRPSGC